MAYVACAACVACVQGVRCVCVVERSVFSAKEEKSDTDPKGQTHARFTLQELHDVLPLFATIFETHALSPSPLIVLQS